MEALFKDDRAFFYVEDDKLCQGFIANFSDINFSNIPHLDTIDILYHYNAGYFMYPVYYEHNDRFITSFSSRVYTWRSITSDMTRDYTIVNLNLF